MALAVASLACSLAQAVYVAPAGAAKRPCRGADVHPMRTAIRAIDTATLCLINRARAAHDVAPLRLNRELGHVAASQVASMVRWDYFADVSPWGQTPLSLVAATGYPAHATDFVVGQNIAWGTGSDTTPAHIVGEWMASAPHREVMLSGEYREAGVAATPTVPAILHARGRGATYAIEFGARF